MKRIAKQSCSFLFFYIHRLRTTDRTSSSFLLWRMCKTLERDWFPFPVPLHGRENIIIAFKVTFYSYNKPNLQLDTHTLSSVKATIHTLRKDFQELILYTKDMIRNPFFHVHDHLLIPQTTSYFKERTETTWCQIEHVLQTYAAQQRNMFLFGLSFSSFKFLMKWQESRQ